MIKNIKGFTVIELVVAVIILAILSTIGFISLSGNLGYTRDSARISELQSIMSAIGGYYKNYGKYPMPTNPTTITYSGATAWYQGVFGKALADEFGFLKNPVFDPLTGNEYSYSLKNSKSEFQLASILEDEINSYFIPNANAYTKKQSVANVMGNYNGQVLGVKISGNIYVLSLPSIITNNLDVTDLEQLVLNKSLVYHGFYNLPASYKDSEYDVDGGFDFDNNMLVIYSGALNNLHNENERLQLTVNLQTAYSGTILASSKGISLLLNGEVDLGSPSDTAKNLACDVITDKLGYRQVCE